MGATERDEWLRAAWKAMVAEKTDPKWLVFVDEMGTNTSLAPLYAYSPKGHRACAKIPRNRGPNTTLLSSMSTRGMGPALAVEGSTTREVFEAYVEKILAPALSSGQIVVMDNLAAHKGERVKELIEERGCELLYLPAYSPDFNPIEEAFSKIKGIVRKAQGRTRGAVVQAIGEALDAVSAGCPRLLRALRIPATRPTTVKHAEYAPEALPSASPLQPRPQMITKLLLQFDLLP